MKESYFSIALTKTEQKNQTKKQQQKTILKYYINAGMGRIFSHNLT